MRWIEWLAVALLALAVYFFFRAGSAVSGGAYAGAALELVAAVAVLKGGLELARICVVRRE